MGDAHGCDATKLERVLVVGLGTMGTSTLAPIARSTVSSSSAYARATPRRGAIWTKNSPACRDSKD